MSSALLEENARLREQLREAEAATAKALKNKEAIDKRFAVERTDAHIKKGLLAAGASKDPLILGHAGMSFANDAEVMLDKNGEVEGVVVDGRHFATTDGAALHWLKPNPHYQEDPPKSSKTSDGKAPGKPSNYKSLPPHELIRQGVVSPPKPIPTPNPKPLTRSQIEDMNPEELLAYSMEGAGPIARERIV